MEKNSLSQKLSLLVAELVEFFEVAELHNAAEFAAARLVKPSLKTAIVRPGIRITVWRYVIEAFAPSPNICEKCESRKTDFFEPEDPDYLLDMFPYGEWLDEDNFAVNQTRIAVVWLFVIMMFTGKKKKREKRKTY